MFERSLRLRNNNAARYNELGGQPGGRGGLRDGEDDPASVQPHGEHRRLRVAPDQGEHAAGDGELQQVRGVDRRGQINSQLVGEVGAPVFSPLWRRSMAFFSALPDILEVSNCVPSPLRKKFWKVAMVFFFLQFLRGIRSSQ